MTRLLIAEDDLELSEFLREELALTGFEICTVKNGADAVIAAVENSFDLLLLDMLMPGMDGIQVIRVLRKVKPTLPIIGLTGYVGRGYMIQATDYGVACLSKPIVMSDLIKEIRETISTGKNDLS